MTDARRLLGSDGEDRVAAHLERAGWQLLARNWRCRRGEIDLIARDPDGVVAVIEVKSRSGLGFGTPLEAVTPAKVRRLRGLAGEWLASLDAPVGRVRLDAVGVLMYPDGTASFEHVRGIEA
jgi:putative endonuclease